MGRWRRSVGRRGRGGAVLGQHPAAVVPQVGGRAGGHRSRRRAGHLGSGHRRRRGDGHHGRGDRRALRGLHGWINALVMSAGGEVLEDPDAGKDANPELESDAGKSATDIIHRLATTVADPALSTAIEENARATFQGDDGGFMVNWPYVYSAAGRRRRGLAGPRGVRRHRLGSLPAGGAGHGERPAARGHRPGDRRVQRSSRRGRWTRAASRRWRARPSTCWPKATPQLGRVRRRRRSRRSRWRTSSAIRSTPPARGPAAPTTAT